MTPNVELVEKFSQILLKKLIIFPNKSSLQRRILIFGEKSSLFHVNDLCASYALNSIQFNIVALINYTYIVKYIIK